MSTFASIEPNNALLMYYEDVVTGQCKYILFCALQRRVSVFEKEEKKKRKEEKKVTSADCNTNFTDYTCISIYICI